MALSVILALVALERRRRPPVEPQPAEQQVAAHREMGEQRPALRHVAQPAALGRQPDAAV
jgi:hypothetical protein